MTDYEHDSTRPSGNGVGYQTSAVRCSGVQSGLGGGVSAGEGETPRRSTRRSATITGIRRGISRRRPPAGSAVRETTEVV